MLMSEQQVRLNDVRLKIREALDFIRFLQENHADRPLAQGLEGHATFFRRQLAALEEEVRQLGALPREPDPEHEVVEQMLTELKSLFGEDKNLVLLQEFNKHRDDIVDTVQYALEVDYPGNIRDTLREVSRYSLAIRP